MSELDDAIDWALSRNPKRFFRKPNGVHLLKIDDFSLELLYSYDSDRHEVILIAVSEIKSKERTNVQLRQGKSAVSNCYR